MRYRQNKKGVLTASKGPLNVRKHAPTNDQVKFSKHRFFPSFSYILHANLCIRRQMAEILNEIEETEMAYFE